MEEWKQYEKESSLDLIEMIRWKNESDEFRIAAECAFIVFCFRYRVDLTKACEAICKRWKHDSTVALEIAKRTFDKFWNKPNFDKDISKVKDIDKGVLLYLYGIAQRELTNYYREINGIGVSPYTGEEEIVRELPDYDFDTSQIEKRRDLKKRYEIVKKALERLSVKHKIIYLTYQTHNISGRNLPKHLLKDLQNELELTQGSIRKYKQEAIKKIEEYLEIYG